MRKGNRIYGIIAVLLLSLGACSLIHDDMEELGYREDGSAYAYVSLTIHTGTTGNVTRANPTGGEDGNGNEKGQDYENRVNNLTLFFYPATLGDGGVNRTGNVDFTAKVYITNPDPNWAVSDGTQPIDKTFKVGPVKVNGLKMNQQYHVLAVANAGQDFGSDITDLNGLRGKTISPVYTYNPDATDPQKAYSDFVMASEGDENPGLEISYENSETNPAETSIDLERLVARVDYQADAGGYIFSITPGLNPAQSSPAQQVTAGVSSRADAQVTASITRAFLVNTYNQGTYVLKRVAEGSTDGPITYLGDETLDNYVIDPLTAQKVSSKYAFSWYDHYFPNLSDEVGIDGKTEWESWLTEGDPITITESGKTETWYRLGYPKENTSSIDAQGKYFSTGVVFEAQYDLTGIGTGFTEGATFFRVNGNLYPTLEAAMGGFDTDFNENKTFNTYNDVKNYLNSLTNNDKSNDDPAGYIDYLKTATADNFGDGSEWTWENYKHKVLSFDKNEQNEYVIATAATRKALHERVTGPNKTETFLNGRGYYTYWIRHNYGGTQDKPGLPMENAIVRNNIYKLTVTSISEIGNDVPGETSLDILVAVAKWTMMDEENWVLVPVKEE